MSEFQKHNLKILVGNAVTAATETTLDTFEATGSVGEVIAVEGDGTATAATSTHVIIASKKADGSIDKTESIPTNRITKAVARKYVAATDQVDYIGFNGTDGAIDETASNLYQVNLRIQNAGSLSPENWYLKQGHYQSSAVASTYSQESVAEGLVNSLIKNFSREPNDKRMKFEMVTSDAGDALGTGVDNVTFTKGSKYFTATDIDDATTNAALAVGNYIRIGTAVTDPIYRITAIDTATDIGTLAVPFEGETVTLADTALEQVTATDVAAGDCGIKITGKAESYKLGIDRFEILKWSTDLYGFTTTVVTESVKASIGIGEGKRVKDMEWFAVGNFGDIYRIDAMAFDTYAEELQASTSGKYNLLTIQYFEETQLFQDVTLPREVLVACSADTGADYTNINKLIDLLNNVTGSAPLAALTALS